MVTTRGAVSRAPPIDQAGLDMRVLLLLLCCACCGCAVPGTESIVPEIFRMYEVPNIFNLQAAHPGADEPHTVAAQSPDAATAPHQRPAEGRP